MVRVPVLSEQMMVRLPRVSTAGSCRMMALFFAMTTGNGNRACGQAGSKTPTSKYSSLYIAIG